MYVSLELILSATVNPYFMLILQKCAHCAINFRNGTFKLLNLHDTCMALLLIALAIADCS